MFSLILCSYNGTKSHKEDNAGKHPISVQLADLRVEKIKKGANTFVVYNWNT